MSNPKPSTAGRESAAVRGEAGLLVLKEQLQRVAAFLESYEQGNPVDLDLGFGKPPSVIVRAAARQIGGQHGDSSAEERAAWDAYAAGAYPNGSEGCAKFADSLLEERRKRFRRSP